MLACDRQADASTWVAMILLAKKSSAGEVRPRCDGFAS